MPIQSGKLNRKIRIEQQDCSARDPEFGAPLETWNGVRETWASIRAVTSKEIFALGPGFTSQVTHTITMRWTAAQIRSGMRVVYGQRVFRIQAVTDPDEGRVELNLMCLEQNEGL